MADTPRLTADEVQRVLEVLMEDSFGIRLNMNDTFAPMADYEDMPIDDLEPMLPLIAKYGSAALTAYAAVRRGKEPMRCKCNHRSEGYYAAKREIETIKASNKDFMA